MRRRKEEGKRECSIIQSVTESLTGQTAELSLISALKWEDYISNKNESQHFTNFAKEFVVVL